MTGHPVASRGEVWIADLAGDKIRPVVVMTRASVAARLHSVIVAPVTTRVRGIPTEVALSDDEGVHRASVANFDNLQLVSRSALIQPIGRLGPDKLAQACWALRYAVQC